MQTVKILAVVSDPATPRLSCQIQKLDRHTVRFVVLFQRTGNRFGASELPRFTTDLQPTLYTHPSEVMPFVTDHARYILCRAYGYLVGRGEYYAD
jgi:hypothetical protein